MGIIVFIKIYISYLPKEGINMFLPYFNGYYSPYIMYPTNYALYYSGTPRQMAADINSKMQLAMKATSQITDSYFNALSDLSNRLEAQNYNTDLKDTCTDVKNSSSALIPGKANSVFSTNSYSSSNEDVVKVNNSTGYNGSSVSVKVHELAKNQITSSTGVSSTGNSLNTSGNINITTTAGSHNINIDLSSFTDNKSALNEISAKINEANAGVTASVKTTGNVSHLELASNQTGLGSEFSVNISGNLSNSFSTFNIQECRDAEYEINNTLYTSNSNTIQICDDKINMTLTGTGSAKIEKGYADEQTIINAVQNFVDDYNDAVNFLSGNSTKSANTKQLYNSFKDIRFSSIKLGNIGVDVSYDGTLSFDSRRFNTALKTDRANVKNILSSVANSAYNKAESGIIDSKYQYKVKTKDRNTTYAYNSLNRQLTTFDRYLSGALFNLYI